MSVDLVIGCPVWDRGWCLDLWFDSVLANCDPMQTGLVFVAPVSDNTSRDVINRRCKDFSFCEVMRDRHEQFDRETRRTDQHKSLAVARNQLLSSVQGIGPRHYLSWDSDLFVEPGIVPMLREKNLPIVTVWTWLNRAEARRVRHYDGENFIPVEYELAMNATAMQWERPRIARHLPAEHWDQYATGLWVADVVLAFQLMAPDVYRVASYAPHPYGEDIPFNWILEQRNIQRWCYGEAPGVHLFEKAQSIKEIELGYPGIMELAQQKPLAARRNDAERTPDMEAIGYYPLT